MLICGLPGNLSHGIIYVNQNYYPIITTWTYPAIIPFYCYLCIFFLFLPNTYEGKRNQFQSAIEKGCSLPSLYPGTRVGQNPVGKHNPCAPVTAVSTRCLKGCGQVNATCVHLAHNRVHTALSPNMATVFSNNFSVHAPGTYGRNPV